MRVAVLALGPIGRDTGGRTYLNGILPALAAQPGLELEVHISDPDVDFRGCRVVSHDTPRFGHAGRIAAEGRIARGLDCDVLLGPLNYLPPRRRGPSVCVQHNLLSLPSAVGLSRDVTRLRRWYRPRALARTLEHATQVAAVSEHLRDLLLEEFPGLDARRIRVAPPGIDLGWARRPAGPAAGRVLCVSALWDYKRVDLAVEAFARLTQSLPDATLRIAGPGSDSAVTALEALATRLGVRDRVELLGAVPHQRMPAVYESSDVLLHLSLLESFGLPVLEAMSAGVPVVATRIGGVAELGGNAPVWLDAAAGSDETAEALQRALTDEGLRAEAVRRGEQRAAQYTWERSAEILADALRIAGDEG